MQEVYDFLKKAQTYFLATAEGDQPRVRAFGTIDLFEDKLYIQTGKGKDVYKQLVANPKFELCAAAGLDWVRVSGTLVPDDRVEPKKHMLDNYPELRAMYDENDDNTIVLYMKDATATFASLTGAAPHTVTF
ncbi:MAG: pyridoxamine 5'-phosphate oxidase family protein [Coriobacteriia bacterium]|nr:pyridoxamine 5'-phosphate oxidase family protein [Coriobacteriia bacterium]